MRQTKINRGCMFSRLVAAVLCLFLIPQAILAQSQTFNDLPSDHWAYKDVEFLISQGYMDGYPDGSFKGRKVTTRYDVALIIARILRRMEERKDSIEASSEAERAALARLTKEFRDELGLLDVRVDSLERRMTDGENKLKELEAKLPKVNIFGFYRTRGQYVLDPSTVSRNEKGDEVNYIKESGWASMYHQLYLRFLGKPFGDEIETFYELYGYASGVSFNRLVYNEEGSPDPFDGVDNYVKRIRNDSYVKTNTMHIVSKAKDVKLRFYANEGITGINNPSNIMTENTNIVDPYQGIEVSGTISPGISYQAGAYKDDLEWDYYDNSEMFSGRVVWELPKSFSDDKLTVGMSYAEKIYGYKTHGDNNDVRAVDINYSTDKMGKIQVAAERLTSKTMIKGPGETVASSKEGSGTKFDLSFQEGGFTGTFKHYDFSKNFRAYMAPIWVYDADPPDCDVGDREHPYRNELAVEKDGKWEKDDEWKGTDLGKNYGRTDFQGEKLNRFSLNYDFGNKLFSMTKGFSVEATYLSKTWEEDPLRPMITDGLSGRKMTFQLISDFTDNTSLKYDFVSKKKALPDAQNIKSNAFELSVRLDDKTSSKGKVYIESDPNDVFEAGSTTYDFMQKIGYFELNSNINPRVFLKGSAEHQVKWASTPRENVRMDFIGEVTYNVTPSTSITGGLQHIDYEDDGDSSNSSLANAIIAEIKKNFTPKLRGRIFYTRGIVEYKDNMKDSLDRENAYGELIYNPTKDSSIRFKFGYDYPDLWKWAVTSVGNGKDFEKMETQKMFIFEARSNF